MTRFKVQGKSTGQTSTVYYGTVEEVLKEFPNAVVELAPDDDYMDYITKIQEVTTKVSDTHYTLEVPFHTLTIKFYYSDDMWHNLVSWRLDDDFMWTHTTPEDFYKQYCFSVKRENMWKAYSDKTIKGIKLTKFYNKKNKVFAVDSEGYLYYWFKYMKPSKNRIAKYEEFVSGPVFDYSKAVYGSIKTSKTSITKWYKNEEEFKEEARELSKENEFVMGDPEIKIKKKGYPKKHPSEWCYINRLPYIDFERRFAIKFNINQYSVLHGIIREVFATSGFEDYEDLAVIEEVIYKYVEYIVSDH